jgi:hypothetical protein
MDIALIKTGDIFYYEDYIPHVNKTHRHRCRVLFVGDENIFYDAWWDGLNKWTFVPVRKRLAYYRLPLTQLNRLHFEGFEAFDKTSADKLYLKLPEILLSTTKEKILDGKCDDSTINFHSDTIAFIPVGPKGVTLKPVLFDTNTLTKDMLVKMIKEHQNLDFIQSDKIVVHRVGLHNGVPSYCIQTG